MLSITEKQLARFWGKVVKSPDTECWEWQGCKLPKGYGRLTIQSQAWNAHRFSYYLAYGEIPKGFYVLHKCDNPPCVNPNHLFLGTAKDNTQDMLLKAREAFGERNGQAILTEENVITIRRLKIIENKTNKEIADLFNISEKYINNICRKKTWKRTGGQTKNNFRAKKLDNEKVLEIIKLCENKSKSYSEIGCLFNISERTVREICSGKIWSHITGIEKKVKEIKTSKEKRISSFSTKITEDTVLKIRHLRNDIGLSIKEVSNLLGVSKSIVTDVSLGNSWKDVGGNIRSRGQAKGSKRSNSKLNEEKVKEIKNLYALGASQNFLCEKFEISQSIISNIVNQKNWTHV